MRLLPLLLIPLFTACSGLKPRERFLLGLGTGAASGAVAGAALAPNQENRGINALVFGLTGAVIGGVGGLLFKDDSAIPEQKTTLKVSELGTPKDAKGFAVSSLNSESELPDFVKERLRAAVIEEFEERESVGPDGSLRAPHKVWRIRYPTQLVVEPKTKEEAK